MPEPEEHFNAGLEAFKAGDMEKAAAALEEATHLDQSSVNAFNYLGATYGALGKYNQAVGAFKMAAQLSPKDPKIHFNIAQAYEAAGNSLDAEYEYGKALEVDPSYSRAEVALAKLRARKSHQP